MCSQCGRLSEMETEKVGKELRRRKQSKEGATASSFSSLPPFLFISCCLSFLFIDLPVFNS
jgi:hypothetical protein